MSSGRVLPFVGFHGLRSQDTEKHQNIVQIGRDRELLRLRGRVLSSAGYTVCSITPDEAPAEIRKATGTQVWVFCHTLQFYELANLAVAIRSGRPQDKLLRLNGPNDIGQLPGLFDAFIEPVQGVDDLVRAVNGLSSKRR